MKVQEVINKYNLSEATIRNWKKLKLINNIDDIKEQEINEILKSKIRSRRNKKNSTHHIIPTSYVDDKNIIRIIKQIIDLKYNFNISNNEILHEAILKLLEINNKNIPDEIIKVLGNRSKNEEFINKFNKIEFNYSNDNDFLGCLYMSILSVGKKDTEGIFYTPFKIVDKIISSVNFSSNTKVLDPGCGSGNFLIQAYKNMKKQSIDSDIIVNLLYGYDIDNIAVLLAKINIYILDIEINFDKINIYCLDYLNNSIDEKFDIVIGNPPWGKKYKKEEKKDLEKRYGSLFSKQDSFAQFILKSFDLLKANGTLSFVLPSSILNISLHKDIRKFLLDYKIESISRIGREFEEIVTDVILMKVDKTQNKDNICLYDGAKINQEVFLNNPNYNFLITSDTTSKIIDKIKNQKSFHLDNLDIVFGLGIVTGNNTKYLLDEKSIDSEPIISGKEIIKYNIDYSKIKKYIIFKKEDLQQVAPESIYRNKNKIIYRFIGKKLVFAVERKGILTLNSANVISFNNNDNIYYICAILNSRLTQLYFDELYNTHKVLKKHIQDFYIFDFDLNTKDEITKLCKKSITDNNYNEKIEKIIYEKLNLTEDEIFYLKGRYK